MPLWAVPARGSRALVAVYAKVAEHSGNIFGSPVAIDDLTPQA